MPILKRSIVIKRVSTARDEKHLNCLSLVAQALSLAPPMTQDEIKLFTSNDPENRLAKQMAEKMLAKQTAILERSAQAMMIAGNEATTTATTDIQPFKEVGMSCQIAVGDKAQRPPSSDKDFNICIHGI